MVKAVGCFIGVGNGGFSFWGAYNGALVWDFGEAGVCSRVLDGICQQKHYIGGLDDAVELAQHANLDLRYIDLS
ncbi:hypothetical protein Godav_004159 [Gossypium davidsonii]|uniref:Uncharacterized protein n=1 Tax=Gossypium davidsonii TaxID=34287 RepID=A0A7J8SKR7_GOSDV|nr:hypothetical protein [Gossypium davidsonii]